MRRRRGSGARLMFKNASVVVLIHVQRTGTPYFLIFGGFGFRVTAQRTVVVVVVVVVVGVVLLFLLFLLFLLMIAEVKYSRSVLVPCDPCLLK